MPIYQYRCDTCEIEFEELVKMDAPIPLCPKCKGDDVKKLISAVMFKLKGRGWARDGYTKGVPPKLDKLIEQQKQIDKMREKGGE